MVNDKIKYNIISEKDSKRLRVLADICKPLDVHTPYTYWLMCRLFGMCSFIASYNDVDIGYILCLHNKDKFFIWQIGVLKEYRGKNIAQTLIKMALDYAKKNQYKTIEVTISDENKASYFGFLKIVEQNGYKMRKVETMELTDEIDKVFFEKENVYEIKYYSGF